MCGGVSYKSYRKQVKTYFPNSQAVLPVVKSDTSIELMTWVKLKKQERKLPQGGWVRLESINKGTW